MVQHRRFAFSLNPDLPTHVSVFAICLSLLLGFIRFFIIDRSDPLHCEALVTSGYWSKPGFKDWQPDGCMLHPYSPSSAETCLRSRSVVFVGDSVTRKLFYQLSNILDPTLPSGPPNDDTKHADYALRSQSGIDLLFHWDPFLNTSYINNMIADSPPSRPHRPSLLVIGSGLWYLRYASDSGGLSAWEVRMKTLLDGFTRTTWKVADQIVILPVEDIVDSKLSPERAATMLSSDLDAMNSDLYHRIHPDDPGYLAYFAPVQPALPVTLPTVFNQMLHPSQTIDGLHFSDDIVRAQANVLLNSHCNDRLPKTFPLDKTCCRSYPHPSLLHFITLVALTSWGPCMFLLNRRYGRKPASGALFAEDEIPPLVISGSLALIYVADRTGFWLKEQKSFNGWTFTFVGLICLAIGLGTVKQADKDLGFLNRDQTDEWKGWMQVAILIYHYFGASKVSGVYNAIRVLVASYLFMTGYGHTMFYLRKADFGFIRMAQIVVRINLFTFFLAYSMNTDYIGYYFSPLVTMWYLVIYATLAPGSKHNDHTHILLTKVAISAGFITWVMGQQWFLEALFETLAQFCGIHWSAKEWAFRVNLDLWIVYAGMLTAILVIKLREHRLTDLPQWPFAAKTAVVASSFVLLWFFTFELTQPDKFAYNKWHPYISVLPVLAFAVLRNANAILRSASSRAFAFVGRCSLETFIIQYHLWLAADTRGILIIVPWSRWRSVNLVITTLMFVLVSHHVSNATGEITSWICSLDGAQKNLPATTHDVANQSAGTSSRHDRNDISMPPQGHSTELKDVERHSTEPPTPQRPHWADRLARSTPNSPGFRLWYGDTEWKPSVKVKIMIGLGIMWVLNMLWP